MTTMAAGYIGDTGYVQGHRRGDGSWSGAPGTDPNTPGVKSYTNYDQYWQAHPEMAPAHLKSQYQYGNINPAGTPAPQDQLPTSPTMLSGLPTQSGLPPTASGNQRQMMGGIDMSTLVDKLGFRNKDFTNATIGPNRDESLFKQADFIKQWQDSHPDGKQNFNSDDQNNWYQSQREKQLASFFPSADAYNAYKSGNVNSINSNWNAGVQNQTGGLSSTGPQQQFPTNPNNSSGLSTVINPNQQNTASTGMSFSPSTNSFNPSAPLISNNLPNTTPNAGALAGVVGSATTQGNNMANIMTPVVNPTITSTQTNAPVAPDWYNNYLSGLATSGQNAINAGGIAGASPLQTAAYNAAPTAINAGQAPLQQATNTATGVATTPTSSLISQYMNPYTQDVVRSIGDLGRQQFREFTAPSVNAAGVATGQFGGSRAQDINAKAARDAAMNITAQQAQALNTGFQNSVTAAQNQQNLGLNSANVLGNLSGQAQGQATSGLNTLSTLGAQQQAINQAQLNYPMNALQNYGSLIAGQSIPVGSRQSVTGPAGSGQLGPSPFSQASQAATGLGALLNTPLASILGKGKEGTIGSGTLDWLKGLLGGNQDYTGNLPSNPNTTVDGSGSLYSGATTGSSDSYANTPIPGTDYFFNPSGQVVDSYGNVTYSDFEY